MPLLAGMILLTFLFLALIAQGRHSLRQMRLDLAADTIALSVSRAQAQTLNGLALQQMGLNLLITKGSWKGTSVGVIKEEQLPVLAKWQQVLHQKAQGFRSFPIGVGYRLAKLQGLSTVLFRPVGSPIYLEPQGIHLLVALNHPPYVLYKYWDQIYYARTWRPDRRQAQPPHTTVWTVFQNGQSSRAAARVWLDVNSQDPLGNGGFPRIRESALGGLGFQTFYPKFNARLLPKRSY